MSGQRYTLTIESLPGDRVPAIARLKSLLKILLRGYGLRVVEAKEIGGEKGAQNSSDLSTTEGAGDVF